MALSNSLVPFLLLFFILSLQLVDSRPTLDHDLVMTNGRSLLQAPKPAINCGAACEVRCSKSWKPKMCKKMCGVCCNKCSCVPPGTSAETRAMCPCYANMRNPKGQLKCP
ncbi:cypmaclein isoform X1 [Elaeis guineensis]|uniref:Peamaclein isoform X1 n=1 Tax=Elaeis guineensis var. tenera TaxID=51953 RepID=A0A6I9S977_ELAGV|nr:peamaclein isoform X1 [Elaeis guineensis]